MTQDENPGKRNIRKGKWAVERERCQIADNEPRPEFGEVHSISQAISNLMKQSGGETGAWLGELHEKWAGVVGESIACHARPGRIRGRRLTVFVDSSVWLNELKRYWSDNLLQRLQATFGRERIEQLSFRLDPDGPGRR